MPRARVGFAECLWNPWFSQPAPGGGVRFWDFRAVADEQIFNKKLKISTAKRNVPNVSPVTLRHNMDI